MRRVKPAGLQRFNLALADWGAKSRSLFVAEFVRIQAFLATHLKSHVFIYGAKAKLNRYRFSPMPSRGRDVDC